MTATTDRAGYADQQDTFGLGMAEIVYLTARTESSSAEKTAGKLRVSEERGNQQLAAAGASSLLARGLVGMDGDELEPSRQLALVNYVFTSARRWTEFGFTSGDHLDAGLVIEAEKATLFLQPRALGVWFIAAADPAMSSAQTLRGMMDNHLVENPAGTVFFSTGTLSTDPSGTLFIRKDGTDHWEAARGTGREKAEETAPGLTSAEVDTYLSGLFSAGAQ